MFVFPLPPLKLSPCRQIYKAGINENGGEKKRGEVSGASRVYCRNKSFLLYTSQCLPDSSISSWFLPAARTYSRWASTLPSCLWSLKIFTSLPAPVHALPFFMVMQLYSALLQLVKQWLNFTYYSHSHAFRYTEEITQILI